MATYDIDNVPENLQSGDIINCPYSGEIKSISLKKGIYKLYCWGGYGGAPSGQTSYGGYSVGTYQINNDSLLYLVSGGVGRLLGQGGYNGGGMYHSSGSYGYVYSGGGASHIALQTGLLSELEDYKEQVLIVAGGGGGGRTNGGNPAAGGLGGGTSGTNGNGDSSYAGKGATQSGGGAGGGGGHKGTFGQGGNGIDSINSSDCTCGAGGGGWYGGGGGRTYRASAFAQRYSGSGGGGSGYVSSVLTSANTYRQDETGYISNPGSTNGYIRIEVVAVARIGASLKIGGRWRNLSAMYCKVDGEWKKVKTLHAKVNEAWRDSSVIRNS